MYISQTRTALSLEVCGNSSSRSISRRLHSSGRTFNRSTSDSSATWVESAVLLLFKSISWAFGQIQSWLRVQQVWQSCAQNRSRQS